MYWPEAFQHLCSLSDSHPVSSAFVVVHQEQQLDVIRELLMDKNSKSQLHEMDRERLHTLYNSFARNSHTAEKSPTGK